MLVRILSLLALLVAALFAQPSSSTRTGDAISTVTTDDGEREASSDLAPSMVAESDDDDGGSAIDDEEVHPSELLAPGPRLPHVLPFDSDDDALASPHRAIETPPPRRA